MPPSEGRPPRPFVPRSKIALALFGPAAIVAIALFAPQLSTSAVDRFGYERFYSRTEPDGRRFQLERKVRSWLPGPELRCVVVDVDGARTVHAVAECAETVTPEQRIQAALLGEPGE